MQHRDHQRHARHIHQQAGDAAEKEGGGLVQHHRAAPAVVFKDEDLVGEEGEMYCGIGRGQLNIAGMPVYRDAVGGVATPTSDEERTKITIDTCTLQMNINGFGLEMPMEEAVAWSVELLRKYANVTEVETAIVS